MEKNGRFLCFLLRGIFSSVKRVFARSFVIVFFVMQLLASGSLADGNVDKNRQQAVDSLYKVLGSTFVKSLQKYGSSYGIKWIKGTFGASTEYALDADLTTFFALKETSNTLIFVQNTIFSTSGGADAYGTTVNLGVGLRKLFVDTDTNNSKFSFPPLVLGNKGFIFGLNAFVDLESSGSGLSNMYKRYSVGGEIKTAWYDIYANMYRSLGDAIDNKKSMNGFDVGVLGNISNTVKLGIRYYRFTGNARNRIGRVFSAEYTPNSLFAVGIKHDNPSDDIKPSVQLYSRVKLALDRPLAEQVNPPSVPKGDVWAKRYDEVKRINVIYKKSMQTNAIVVSSEKFYMGEGETRRLSVKLAKPVVAGKRIVVKVQSSNASVLQVVSPQFLTFNSANYNTEQIVTLSALQDSDKEDTFVNVVLRADEQSTDTVEYVKSLIVGVTVIDDDKVATTDSLTLSPNRIERTLPVGGGTVSNADIKKLLKVTGGQTTADQWKLTRIETTLNGIVDVGVGDQLRYTGVIPSPGTHITVTFSHPKYKSERLVFWLQVNRGDTTGAEIAYISYSRIYEKNKRVEIADIFDHIKGQLKGRFLDGSFVQSVTKKSGSSVRLLKKDSTSTSTAISNQVFIIDSTGTSTFELKIRNPKGYDYTVILSFTLRPGAMDMEDFTVEDEFNPAILYNAYGIAGLIRNHLAQVSDKHPKAREYPNGTSILELSLNRGDSVAVDNARKTIAHRGQGTSVVTVKLYNPNYSDSNKTIKITFALRKGQVIDVNLVKYYTYSPSANYNAAKIKQIIGTSVAKDVNTTISSAEIVKSSVYNPAFDSITLNGKGQGVSIRHKQAGRTTIKFTLTNPNLQDQVVQITFVIEKAKGTDTLSIRGFERKLTDKLYIKEAEIDSQLSHSGSQTGKADWKLKSFQLPAVPALSAVSNLGGTGKKALAIDAILNTKVVAIYENNRYTDIPVTFSIQVTKGDQTLSASYLRSVGWKKPITVTAHSSEKKATGKYTFRLLPPTDTKYAGEQVAEGVTMKDGLVAGNTISIVTAKSSGLVILEITRAADAQYNASAKPFYKEIVFDRETYLTYMGAGSVRNSSQWGVQNQIYATNVPAGVSVDHKVLTNTAKATITKRSANTYYVDGEQKGDVTIEFSIAQNKYYYAMTASKTVSFTRQPYANRPKDMKIETAAKYAMTTEFTAGGSIIKPEIVNGYPIIVVSRDENPNPLRLREASMARCGNGETYYRTILHIYTGLSNSGSRQVPITCRKDGSMHVGYVKPKPHVLPTGSTVEADFYSQFEVLPTEKYEGQPSKRYRFRFKRWLK